MIRRPPRSTRTDTLFPYTTLFRSEMRGGAGTTPAHQGDALAEMVCSNSFRSDDGDSNAVGLLHREMRALGSLVMREADATTLPAGSALAVDRDMFAQRVTRAPRSADRRVGQECVSTFRYRWSADH